MGVIKKKKSKKSKNRLESYENVENVEPAQTEEIKSKKRKNDNCNVGAEISDTLECDIRHKKSKKAKKLRLEESENAELIKTDEDKIVKQKEDSTIECSDSLQCDNRPKKKKKKKLKGGSD